ncbi:hypothetical protein ES703_25718 [subsurface metagenome]
MESIKELRVICQSGHESSGYLKHVNRRISIYITKLLLHTPITGNQVTLFGILLGIASGILFSFGNYWYSIAAALLINLSEELDYVDGEVARYRGTSSPLGHYLDILGHIIVYPTLFMGIAYGIYNNFHNPIIFIFGCSAFLCFALLPNYMSLNISRILQAHREEGVKTTKGIVKQPQLNKIKMPNLLSKIADVIYLASGSSPVLLWLLVAVALNSTHLFLIIFGILLPGKWLLSQFSTVLALNSLRR